MIMHYKGIIRDMHKDLCTVLLITALFVSTKAWEQSKCHADEAVQIR